MYRTMAMGLFMSLAAFPLRAQSGINDDLSVRYIHRTPEIDFVPNASDPSTEGWPEVGQEVTWQAIVKNWSNEAVSDVAWEWHLDGVPVSSGMVDIPARGEATVEYAWNWTFERHELEFALDTNGQVQEFSETNNAVAIFTDALTVGFYVEQSLYDFFHEHQHKLGDGANSFDDWAQRNVRMFNEALAGAIYPETPEGVLDRVRLDAITIVEDDELPLADIVQTGNGTIQNPSPELVPNGDDRTVDIQSGFVSSSIDWPGWEDHESADVRNPFWYHGVMWHETGHARYLIDVYGFNVIHNFDGNQILITENDEPVIGTPFMPADRFGPEGPTAVYIPHRTEIAGLMNSNRYEIIDRYSAAALNLIAGRRAVSGNFNAPQNLGVFMNDLPAENRLIVRNEHGTALSGASVSIYWSETEGRIGEPYFKYFDDQPDLEFTSDGDGVVLLGRNPFSPDDIRHGLGGTNGVAIVRVEHDGLIGYGFLESMYFNLKYWSGDTELAAHDLSVTLVDPTSVTRESAADVPSDFALGPAFPNPFDHSTTIPFELRNPGYVTLTVFDALGRKVATLVEGDWRTTGPHSIEWSASEAPSGTYFYHLETPSGVTSGRVTKVK